MRQATLRKAYNRINTDGVRHCITLYGATAITLWLQYGKRKQAIKNLFDMSRTIWVDCAKDHDHSMIQMCEDETGIEVNNGEGKSWKEIWFLNGHIPDRMTDAQVLYMRQQQLKWIRPQVMACLMIALHRKYGFGFDRCARIYQQIDSVSAEYGDDHKRIREACLELTGIDVADVVTKKGEKQ